MKKVCKIWFLLNLILRKVDGRSRTNTTLKVSLVNLLHFFHATKKTKTLFIFSYRKLNSKKLCQSVASSVNWARRDSCWEASFLEELSKYKRDCMAKQRITFCRIFWTHTDIHFDGVCYGNMGCEGSKSRIQNQIIFLAKNQHAPGT